MNQPNQETPRTRDRQGQFTPDPATAERDAQAAELRKHGKTYREIAAELGTSVSVAHDAVTRAMAAARREPGEQVIAMSIARLEETRDRLNRMRADILALLDRGHVTVSQGKVVYDDKTDMVVPDDDFTLRAIDRLMKVEAQLQSNDESRRRLEGLDQPAKTTVTGGITYEIVGIDPGDLR